jgi:hypothetical protein
MVATESTKAQKNTITALPMTSKKQNRQHVLPNKHRNAKIAKFKTGQN